MHKAIHSGRLERWLGAEGVQTISEAMRPWYGPPIAVAGVPGEVYINRGGDFSGRLNAGFEATAYDRAHDLLRRLKRGYRVSVRKSHSQMNAGFTSLSDLIAAATAAGGRREFAFQKTGTTGVFGVTNSLWAAVGHPTAGAVGSAAPGGRATTNATTGGMPFANPTGGDTQHLVSAFPISTTAGMNMLLYDRIFDVLKTPSSTATESVTGVPSRYQSSTATDADYAGGNFAFVEVITAMGATAHDWTVCQYRNQAGTDAQSFPSMTGNSSAIENRLDHPVGSWFMPLASGDTGVMDLAQMQCSASVTGSYDFVIGHPIAWMPCPIANMVCTYDGVSTAFSLARIFDNACLSFLEVMKPVTTATNYAGQFITVAG